MQIPPFVEGINSLIFVENEPVRADVIFVPGGHTGVHAVTAARLYREGWSERILPSGRYSKLIGHYVGPESERFSSEWEYLHHVLQEEGVPEQAILKEDQATFTWENAIFSAKLLREMNVEVKNAILCCQAHHAGRALMYYRAEFPDTHIAVVPSVVGDIRRDNWFLDQEKTNVVLGEVERIGRQFHCMLPVAKDRAAVSLHAAGR